MMILSVILVAVPITLFAYAYGAYPLILFALPKRHRNLPALDPADWPMLTITLPAYNEERTIRSTIESLLCLDYPAHQRQIVVLSDASTDRTDEIVREYRDQGIELLRLPVRKGKSAAENAAGAVIRGEIVVNIDATVRVPSSSLKPLIRVFQDPEVGVASGRDISIGRVAHEGTAAESGYVDYEMWVRALETRVDSIVGASGCFYAIRASIYDSQFPETLSRDFASAFMAKEHGMRAVSVDEAICLVPRTPALDAEYRRKVRTMARGLETLWYKRALMNPQRYGIFALMLMSHKLCRWLCPISAPVALVGLALASAHSIGARVLLLAAVGAIALGIAGLLLPQRKKMPAIITTTAYLVASTVAAFAAWARALRKQHSAMWEPTRRPLSELR